MIDDILVSSDTNFVTADNERGPISGQAPRPQAGLRPVYRQEDLVRRALTQLGAVGNGQDLAPEDAERVRFSVPAILAELYERGIYAFAFDGDVPAAAFESLSVVVASALSSDFGLPQDEIVTLASRAQAAEGKLRTMRAQPYVSVPTQPEYF